MHGQTSRELEVRHEYLHELRGPNGSDHSALLLDCTRREPRETLTWAPSGEAPAPAKAG